MIKMPLAFCSSATSGVEVSPLLFSCKYIDKRRRRRRRVGGFAGNQPLTHRDDMGVKILSALDSAKTQYYHFKAIIIAGMGLFTDAYDLFCISPVMKVIGRIYYPEKDGVTPPGVISATIGIALLGTAIGQVVFGRLGDKMGRRKVYGVSLLLMVFSSIGCGFSVCRTRTCVLTSLCFFRFLLGLGIGGDYPLSATIMSEFANKRTRGAFIAAVFSMQGFGILVSSCVTMAVTAAFERATARSRLYKVRAPPVEADFAWRLILMLGALPAGLTFYWRMMMPETARYTALVEKDIRKATTDMQMVLEGVELQLDDDDEEEEEEEEAAAAAAAKESITRQQRMTTTSSYGFFSREFLGRHGKDLFACAGSWFLVDVVFYSSNLFQSRIYKSFFPDKHKANVYQDAFDVAKFQSIIALGSTIPGYWAAVYLIDRVGRKKLHVTGFFFMAVFLFAIGGPYDKYWERNTTAWFIVLYALTFFFANMGPNTTTFIVPAEMFPARFRSTCHGIAGAVGKVGAMFGAIGFIWASQSTNTEQRDRGYPPGIGMMASLLILAGVSVVGVVFAMVFMRETKGISLEENESPEDDGGVGGVERNGVVCPWGSGSDASQRSSDSL